MSGSRGTKREGDGRGDDASRWELLERLFDEAIAQPAATRKRWLEARVPDRALRADLEVMLASHEGNDTLGRLKRDLINPIIEQRVADDAPVPPGEGERIDVVQRTLSGYTLERELGGGGMSRVFVAREDALGRTVVVKLLTPELSQGLSMERFDREIRLAARLQEPHIVPILSAGFTTDGSPYYTMPYVRGESLRARIQRGALPMPEAVSILRDVVRALAYAHEQGIVHRDIKPENVLLHEGTAVVTDFGIAKAIAASTHAGSAPPPPATLTQVGTALGTPAYMSPEQCAGDQVDQRTDLYSWGMMAWELLAGRHPFAGKLSMQQLLAAQLSDVPPEGALRERGVPGELVALVAQCVQKDASKRPPTARALLDVIDPLRSGSGPVSTRGATRGKRGRWIAVGGAVVAIAAAGIAFVLRGGGGASPPGAASGGAVRTLAVLPFEHIGGDTSDAYLAQGLTDQLSITLGSLPGMRIAPRTSGRVLQGKGLTLPEIARQLDVQGILTGTIRSAGARLRVSFELVDGRAGRPLHTGQIEERRDDVFAVEDRVTKAIVDALQLQLSGGAQGAQVASRGTTNPEAYDLYLRGRYFWSLRNEESIRRAIDFFTRAAQRDSSFVPALSGLADAYAVSAFYGWLPPADGYGKAREIAQRALALDSLRAEPHASLAYTAMYYDFDWGRADSEFTRAAQLDSTYATTFQWIGNFQAAMGNEAAAIAGFSRGERLDPLNRITVAAHCWGYYMFRRVAEAVRQCDKAIEIDSSFAIAHMWKGQALAMAGDRANALRELESAVSLSGRGAMFVTALAHAQASFGDRARARALLAQVVPPRYRYIPSYEIATVHAALGDPDTAMQWLERAFEERSHSMALLRIDPALDPLRKDPRFVALLAKLKLG